LRKPSAAADLAEQYDEDEEEVLDEYDEEEAARKRAQPVPGGYDDLTSRQEHPGAEAEEEDWDGEGPRSERKRVSVTPVVNAAAPAVPWSLREQRESMVKIQQNAAVGYGRRIRDMRTKEGVEVFHIQTLASLAEAMQVSLGEITKKLKELDVC